MNLNFYKLKQGWKYLCTLIAALLIVSSVNAGSPGAEVTVSGRVTSSEDGSAIPGVNVLVKGTQTGTITDGDGKYTISAPDNGGTLVFSYIGFVSQEAAITGRTTVDVVLEVSTESLNEVVVTALGIERQEQSLGFSVGKVKGSDITGVAQENVLNGLAGRVAGVTINSTGGAGSSVRMTIRGTKSLVGDNQPLFIVDGVQMNNTVNNISQVGSDNRVDYGNSISDLNPETIESISVLKPPSAAALYGSRAGNGVVIITTKNGSKSKKMTVNITSNTVFDIPYRYLDLHTKFASGYLPFTPTQNIYPDGILQVDETSVGGVGPELDKGYNAIQWNSPLDANGNPIPTPLISHKNNIKNFVQTGITTTNGASISNSNDLVSYRLTYSNMANRGIIPNSDLFKNTLGLNSSIKAASKLTISTSLDISRSNSNNRPATNRGANPMQWAYAVSPHIDIRDLRSYWVPGQEGLLQRTQDNNAGEYNNPYFLAYENNNSFVRDRFFGNIKADWQLTPELTLMGRYGVDTYNESRETKMATSYTNQERGAYGITNIKELERNIDFLLTYTKNLNSFTLTSSVGGNTRFNQSNNATTRTRNGTGLVIPGLFTLANIKPADLEYGSGLYERSVNSIYGLVNIGFKDMVFLDLTARNDWSSTLPKSERSYFYPSASVSILANEIFHMPNEVALFKLRGGIAKVGNDTDPYRLLNTLNNLEAWDGVTRLSVDPTLLIPNLKPEMATSYEGGLDLNLFNNKIRFGATYYYLENKNQILQNPIAPSSGFERLNFNAGLVVSRGLELTLGGTPIDRNGLRLDANFNFSKNESIIKELSDGQKIFTFWTDAKGGAWTYVGDKIGDLYDTELVTVTDKSSPYFGYPLLNEDGSWESVSAANSKNKIGNYNPDFLLGLQTSLTYKRFTLNLSFDWRHGGNFVSQTYRYSESDLKSQRFLDLLINPNGMGGDELRNYLVANEDDLIKVSDHFNIVGGPTAEYGGFPFELQGQTYPYGVFNPGVIAEYDDDGNITGYVENLGNAGTRIIPYGDNYPWDFTKAATFDASFIKLREISLGYALPSNITKKLGMQAASVSVYSRNIMLWTKAGIGIDPETAFQQETSSGGGLQFKQGIERYNVIPWSMPVGFKLNLTF